MSKMATSQIETTSELVKKVYESSRYKIGKVKPRWGKPLTYTEKILFGHLEDPENQPLERGKSFLMLCPDRVALQDATAQMAILQFMLAQKSQTSLPTTVHCDHLIRAYEGADSDLSTAQSENKEVYDFLASASHKYGLGFWAPGAGIIHQVVLENYAFPGGLMIGTDSHTPNAGGLGMVASGVGGADASDVMAGLSWEVKYPKIIGVHLRGKLSGWTSSKDVILKLLGILTVKGGTNCIIEYFGEGTRSLSATGKGTITNMGAELGATCSIFPFDDRMSTYLRSTERGELAKLAEENKDMLCADPEVLEQPEVYYDQVIEIDLDTLEPHLVGPHSPDIAKPLSEMKEHMKEGGWPTKLSAALVGSCTNSSYEDIGRSAHVARQALEKGLRMKVPFLVTPGSEMIHKTIQRDGQMKSLNDVGANVLANACGPCIGQWRRDGFEGKTNTIVTSFNRNFRGRNDGNALTLGFMGSPEVVVALGLSGDITFNPLTDTLKNDRGEEVQLKAPSAPELPADGFVRDEEGYQAPTGSGHVVVKEGSERLQLLTPFVALTSDDYKQMKVLIKVKGKCTTDHISPAGKWLKYRGHLDNISNNMFVGATNVFTDEIGKVKNQHTGDRGIAVSVVARDYKAHGIKWIAVGDENYGEGSSREHAAMSPRFLGAAAVVAKSFARIHETNLKKQGVLALTFSNPVDYEKICEDDEVSITGFDKFARGSQFEMCLRHSDGSKDVLVLDHTYNADQINWFKAGSALNHLSK